MVQFSDKAARLAIRGLIGCTAVVVASKQGAWAAHFWEKPYLERDVIPTLRTGNGEKFHSEHGLEKLRNNDDRDIGHIFDNTNQPRIFIMAPRQRVRTTNGKFDNSETAGGDVLGDEEFVGAIVAELRRIFGDDAPLSLVQYSPEIEPIIPGDYRDNEWENHRGKLLVQYQPAKGTCRTQAQWRVWFEGRRK